MKLKQLEKAVPATTVMMVIVSVITIVLNAMFIDFYMQLMRRLRLF